ncbi:hypothetical protein [Cumulibacter soli]|uniref:hypothetical protein n=1 Tax=Cumulibacter soli TaxID=2546344 RepID=UPI00106767B9|nr:hypothetical protein [Cumulibacter soli]
MTAQFMAYTVEKAVEVCGGVLTLNYLSEAIRRRECDHVRIGRNVGITPKQLRDFLAKHEVKAKTSDDDTSKPTLNVLDGIALSPRSRAHHERKAAGR